MSTQYDSNKPELEGLTHAVSRAVLAHSCPEVLRHKTAEGMFGKLDRIITEYLDAFTRVVKNAEDFNYMTVPAYLEALDRMTDHFSAIGIDDLYAQVFQEEGTDYSIDRSSRMEDALASMVYAMAPVVWPHASYGVLSAALYSPQHGLHLRGAILTVLHDSFSTKSGLNTATKRELYTMALAEALMLSGATDTRQIEQTARTAGLSGDDVFRAISYLSTAATCTSSAHLRTGMLDVLTWFTEYMKSNGKTGPTEEPELAA